MLGAQNLTDSDEGRGEGIGEIHLESLNEGSRFTC